MIPPVRVLAAVDFSEASRSSLSFARRLARHCGAELHVMHAEDPLLAAAARSRGMDLASEVRDELRAFAAATSPSCNLRLRYHVVTGEAVDGILNVAHRENVDVIVLGAHGMSGAGRLVFGSVAEGVLRHADLSVLVVPDAWTPPTPDTLDLSGIGPVVCGVDMTLPSIEAATAGARLAVLLKTHTRLVHVVPELRVLERWQSHAEDATRNRVEQARRDLEHVVKIVERVAPAQLQVESGSVPERLAEVAHAYEYALLVLGRALRGPGSAPPGSNAYRALGLADVPVLMHVTRE